MPILKTHQKCGFDSEQELANHIVQQNQSGVDIRQLAKNLGVGSTSLWRTIKKFNIEIMVGHGYLKHGFKSEAEFATYLKKLYETNTIPEIAAKLGTSITSIQVHYFDKYGIKKRTSGESLSKKIKPINITGLELQIINGMLLGDGCLYVDKNRKFTNAVLQYTCHYKEVLNNIRFKVLKRFGWHFKTNSYFDNRTNKMYTNYTIVSRSYPDLTALRNKWYPNGTKIVPKDIKLTPETCYWWYLGDGSSSNSSLKLCTNGFTIDDVLYLIKLMPVECTNYSPNGPMIHINKRSERRKFLDYIGPCRNGHKCYKYRWIINDNNMKPCLRWN